jgi:TIR domain
MGFAYDRIAGFLASGFRDVAALVGAAKLATATPPVALIARGVEEPPDGYLYDVFVSYPEASTAWVMEVVRLIELELTDLRPARPRIFADVREIEAARWAPRISDALNRSKVMLAFISPSYAMGQAGREFEIFDLRAQQTGCPVLVPVLLQSGAMPSLFEQRRWLDLTRYRGRSSTRSAALRHELHALARRLNECIDLAPPFDPSWLAGDDDAPAVAAVTGAGER